LGGEIKMPTKKEIDDKYLAEHGELEKRYYERHEITKEEFDRLHGELWKRHEEELVNAGYRKWIWVYDFGIKHPEGNVDVETFAFDHELSDSEIRNLERKLDRVLIEKTRRSTRVK